MRAVLFGTGVFLFSMLHRLLFSRFWMAAWQPLPGSVFFVIREKRSGADTSLAGLLFPPVLIKYMP